MPFVIEQTGVPTVDSDEVFYLSTLLTVYPAASASAARRFRTRLYVDNVEISVPKSVRWSHSANDIAGTLEIELADLSDRSLFTRTASIKCEVEEYIAGVWTLVKTYCDGAILATSNYSLANNGINPNDSFTVTVLPVLQQRLETSPDEIVVLYDPAKITVDEDELETLPDIDGNVGTPTVTPVANMTLADVFEYVADVMGFDGYRTNINTANWELTRVDFPAAQPYWNTVAGIIGNHEPKLSIDADNKLVIRDGTLVDTTSSRTMTLANFASVSLAKEIERFKGTVLTYQARATGWDYYEFRQERKLKYFGGVTGQYPMTETVTWYQDFYRNSFPNTPVFSQVFAVKRSEWASASVRVSATAELFSYQFGQGGVRLTRHDLKEWGFAKAPQAWITAQFGIAGPDTLWAGGYTGAEDTYTSASDATFTESFVLTKAERTNYTYFPMPGVGGTSYVGQTDAETKGLITIDADNQMLGEDFEQPLSQAQEAGNLAEGQGSRWGVTDRRKELQETEARSRKVSLRTQRHSALNSTSGFVAENYYDRRIGDIGDDSELKAETKQVKITAFADSTAKLWRTVNGGEAPLSILQPLCHRLNKRQDYPGGINAQLPGYDHTIAIGQVIDPQIDGRGAVSLGLFEITGYTDTIEEGRYITSITAEQVG